MPRKTDHSMAPRHVLIDNDDWALLEQKFGPKSGSKIGVGKVIRQIVHQKCQELRAKLAEQANTTDAHQ